jgi:serine/threonine protein kinase
MSKELFVTAGPDKGRVFAVPDGNPLVIGRAKETDTKLTDPHVSRTHCQVELDGDQLLLTNKSSAGGTFINGKRVTDPCVLAPGDVIRIGETELRYVTADAAATTRVGPAGATARAADGGAERLTELAGKTLAHFEVGDVLHRGPISAVFKARDAKENRTVALKVFAPEFSKDDDDRQRFIRAMKTMLPLRHPNLVALYGAGKTGPHCWISMELVEGESATQMIQRIGTAGMLDWRNGLRVAVHVARALEFAQQHAIIHRNITPQNILVQSSDKLTKLGDLMLAKALEGTLAEPITRPGEILGDVRYMSPERTRGTTDVDGRSDIYSLGATVYALLTGRPPFEGGSLVETITKIRNEAVVKPTKYQLAIPGLLEGAVLKMLEKRPEDRFQSSSDLVRDLERVAKFQGLAV